MRCHHSKVLILVDVAVMFRCYLTGKVLEFFIVVPSSRECLTVDNWEMSNSELYDTNDRFSAHQGDYF